MKKKNKSVDVAIAEHISRELSCSIESKLNELGMSPYSVSCEVLSVSHNFFLS